MSAEVTGNLVTIATITTDIRKVLTYRLELPKKIDSGQMELMKSTRSTLSHNIYEGIKSSFKTSHSFKINDKSQRAVIEGENIEIVGTTQWQKFEEKQYFDGKRTIKLVLGKAKVIKDRVEEDLIQDVEYELPPSFANTQNSSTNKNYLNLKKGWLLISSPINQELNILETFYTSEVSYKFQNNSWIKELETLKPNEGMWINYNFNIYVHFDEYNSSESYEFNSTILNIGWNLVGTGADINLGTNEFNNIWAFDNIEKTWINNPSTIKRGYGFWVKK